jgi:hypothetical protein
MMCQCHAQTRYLGAVIVYSTRNSTHGWGAAALLLEAKLHTLFMNARFARNAWKNQLTLGSCDLAHGFYLCRSLSEVWFCSLMVLPHGLSVFWLEWDF